MKPHSIHYMDNIETSVSSEEIVLNKIERLWTVSLVQLSIFFTIFFFI